MIFRSDNKAALFKRVVKESEKYLKRRSKKSQELPIHLPSDERFLQGRPGTTIEFGKLSRHGRSLEDSDDDDDENGSDDDEEDEDELAESGSEDHHNRPKARTIQLPRSVSASSPSSTSHFLPTPLKKAKSTAVALVPEPSTPRSSPSGTRQSKRLILRYNTEEAVPHIKVEAVAEAPQFVVAAAGKKRGRVAKVEEEEEDAVSAVYARVFKISKKNSGDAVANSKTANEAGR